MLKHKEFYSDCHSLFHARDVAECWVNENKDKMELVSITENPIEAEVCVWYKPRLTVEKIYGHDL